MGIWASIDQGDRQIEALDAADDAANYRAEGPPPLLLDVGTATSYHDHIRLTIFSKDPGYGVDVDAILSPQAARTLIEWLQAALDKVKASGG